MLHRDTDLLNFYQALLLPIPITVVVEIAHTLKALNHGAQQFYAKQPRQYSYLPSSEAEPEKIARLGDFFQRIYNTFLMLYCNFAIRTPPSHTSFLYTHLKVRNLS